MNTFFHPLRAALVGAAATTFLMAFSADAQVLPSPTVIDINQVLAGEGIIEIDLNADSTTDFLVEIVTPPVLFPSVSAVEEPADFGEAIFELPVVDDDGQPFEVALIRAVSRSGAIFVDADKVQGTPFAATFNEGDIVQENFDEFFDTPTALLYFDTVRLGEDAPDVINSFGPFSNTGDNAFIGLSLQTVNPETEAFETNFGFLEITRGSVIVGQQGFQELPGAGAQIGAATVPVPAPLAFLAVALLGLFGLRRRG